MSTVNLVLTIVLSAILGFMIGSAYGQAKMKLVFTQMLDKLSVSLKGIANTSKKEGDRTNE